MSRARLNLFIQPEHAKRLNELAITKGVSKSSIIASQVSRMTLNLRSTDRSEIPSSSAISSTRLAAPSGLAAPMFDTMITPSALAFASAGRM